MPPRAAASPDEIQVPTVFGALRRKSRSLVLLSLAAGCATFGVLTMMAPRYKSEAELAIVAKGASSTFSDPQSAPSVSDLVTTQMDKEAINTHVRALQSTDLMQQIASDLKLNERREFNSALGPVDQLDAALRMIGIGGPLSGESERDRVMSALRGRLEVYSPKESRFIGVRMTSLDPELAAKIANAITENYSSSLARQGVTEIDTEPFEAQIISKAQAESVPVFPKKLQLSSLVTFASLMFGTAWIVVGALFRTGPQQGYRKKDASGRRQAEPVLVALDDEPLICEMVDEMNEPGAPEPPSISIPAQASASYTVAPKTEAPEDVASPAAFTNGDMEAVAERIRKRRTAGGGYRTLITGETDEIVPYAEAIELVKALVKGSTQPILVDWSPSGNGFARDAGLTTSPGFNDLLSGSAGFDEIIQRLPGTKAHAVASGEAVSGDEGEIDADHLNLVLDALDEAYDHIIVVGRRDEARRLFEGIEGRFDAGIAVASTSRGSPANEDRGNMFLGFEVAEIDVIRYERQERAPADLMQRLARVSQQHVPLARRA